MIIRRKTHALIPLLALSMSLVMAASVQAQVSFQVTLGTTPHWTDVPGTRVQVIDPNDRPGYDMFHYGNEYYVYNNNRWYRSNQWRGSFNQIEDRYVPTELANVPPQHWRNYPSQWQNRNDRGSDGSYTTFQVNFGTTPGWMDVPGTRVQVIRQDQRPGYDMFRYGNEYYVYNNNRWYRSNQWRGSFNQIEDRYVPTELANVPPQQWRNYPSQWQNRNDRGWGGSYTTFQVNFRNTPRWTNIRGTRVQVIRQMERPDYDMFRYGGMYYVYNNDRWYTSRQWRGTFTLVDNRSVPREFSRIPRQSWRNYPQAWMDQMGNPRNVRDRRY